MFIEEIKIGWRKGLVVCMAIGLAFLAGCISPSEVLDLNTYKPLLKSKTYQNFFKTDKYRFFSPEKVIAAPLFQGNPINPILPSLGPVDTTEEIYPNAEYPNEQDYLYSDKDYVIGPSDLLGIGIMDLFLEGQEYQMQRKVSESGYLSMPLIEERVRATGLTAVELEKAISDAYQPEILLDPTVSVAIIDRRQSMFSIVGAVDRPSTYNVIKPDMTLLDALALAGWVTDPRIKYIYVIRQKPPELRDGRQAAEKAASPTGLPALPELPSLPPLAEPSGQMQPDNSTLPQWPVEPSTPPQSDQDQLRELEQILEGSEPTQPGPQFEIEPIPAESELAFITELDGNSTAPVAQPQPVKYKWKYVNGRWIPEAMPGPEPVITPATAPARPVPPPALPEIEAEPAPSTLPADIIVPEIAPKPVITPPRPAPGVTGEIPSLPVEPAAPQVAPVERRIVPAQRRDMRAEIKPAKPFKATPQDPFGWAEMDKSSLTRIIAVNYEMLTQGNERMNIVVHDSDKIIVPLLEVGLYYVQGEVIRPGVYVLTGRDITVKQALTEAGNMSPLAWPQNAMLIRRIGERQEQYIPLDIEAIFKGEENDFFLKPDDVICIGTDVRSIFYAVLRNAFRMTYGFGFIYDRNFSSPLFEETSTSRRFTRL